MRITTLAGIALIVASVALLIFGGSFTSRRDVLDVGGLTVTAEERRPIQPWVAGVGIIGGLALVFAGARHKD